MLHHIENDLLKISIQEQGVELTSIFHQGIGLQLYEHSQRQKPTWVDYALCRVPIFWDLGG